jgi:tripartite-type tricarboxylate transporter receptor subunit TctC
MIGAHHAEAKEFPSKPLTIVCPWSAGGGTDRTARFMAEQLSARLGQPVNVVNKTGGAGAVGFSAGATARPDGYTITNLTFEINTLKHLGYSDLTPENYVPLLQFNEDASAVIVHKDAPYETIQDLLDDIKAQPEGSFTFSGSSIGSVWDLARVGLLNKAGIDPNKVKYVPSKGAAPAITELLGKHVDVITCSYPEAASQVEAGELKVLVIMADERNPQFDQVPTAKEQGFDFSYGTWRGYALPAKTKPEVAQVLIDAFQDIVASDEFKDFMARNGFGIKVRAGDEFMTYMVNQFNGLSDIIELAGYGKK